MKKHPQEPKVLVKAIAQKQTLSPVWFISAAMLTMLYLLLIL